MNSFELIPTEENLIHTLDKDLLKRNKDLVRFYDLILGKRLIFRYDRKNPRLLFSSRSTLTVHI